MAKCTCGKPVSPVNALYIYDGKPLCSRSCYVAETEDDRQYRLPLNGFHRPPRVSLR